MPSLEWGSVQFSHSMAADSLRPHGLHHNRLPCPSPTPGACSNSCPSSWWCHSTVSSSVIPFSSCPQSFPASGYFLVSQFFTSGGQSIGASASALVLPMNIQDWFSLGLTGWTPCRPTDSQESSPTPQFKASFGCSLLQSTVGENKVTYQFLLLKTPLLSVTHSWRTNQNDLSTKMFHNLFEKLFQGFPWWSSG